MDREQIEFCPLTKGGSSMVQGIFFDLQHLHKSIGNQEPTETLRTFETTFPDFFHELETHQILCQVSNCRQPISEQLSHFLYQAKEKGIPQENLLFVSDSSTHLQTGKQAGFFVVGYDATHAFLPADYCFEDFSSIDFDYFQHVLCRYQKKPLSILSTERLFLRELSTKDLPDLYAIYQEPDVYRHMNLPAESYDTFFDKLSSYIEKFYPFYDMGMWGVFLKETGQLIGECGIQPSTVDSKEEIELGYLLSQPYQKQGLAREMVLAPLQYAKEQFSCSRIVAQILPDNAPSIALAKQCGMTYEKSYHQNDTLLHVYVKVSTISSPQRCK